MKNNKNDGQRQGTGKIHLAFAAAKLNIGTEKVVRYLQQMGYTVKKGPDTYIPLIIFRELEMYVAFVHVMEERIAKINKIRRTTTTNSDHRKQSLNGTSDDIGNDEIRVLGKTFKDFLEKNVGTTGKTNHQTTEGTNNFVTERQGQILLQISEIIRKLLQDKHDEKYRNDMESFFTAHKEKNNKIKYPESKPKKETKEDEYRNSWDDDDDPYYFDDDDDYYGGSCDDLDDLEPDGYPDDWDW